MKKIMVVDDSMFMRKVLKDILTAGGYNVSLEAGDGEEAIKKFATTGDNKPDLILLDINMPKKDGIEVLKEILKMHPASKIVMCSMMGHEKIIHTAINIGAQEFITKPFEVENLLETIEKVI